MAINSNGRGVTINGTALTKVLASINGVLLAIALYVLSTFGGTQADHSRRLNATETSIAVIEGNRFTSNDAMRWENRVEDEVELHITSLRTEMNARFDRLEARIDRIGGEF